MAIYRPIHISFWQDNFVLELTPEEKYFYLYLMTNSKTKQSGAYELPIKIITLETGYNSDTIKKLIDRFTQKMKIVYDEKTSEILLINWMKYNPVNNRNIYLCVKKEISEIKSEKLKTRLNYILESFEGEWKKGNEDYAELLQEEIGLEFEPEPEKENKIPFDKFWDLYDKKVGSKTKLEKKWNKLSLKTQERILEHIPIYLESTPDKKYRKNPETYLNNESWNDEIIRGHNESNRANTTGSINRLWDEHTGPTVADFGS